MVVLSLVKNKHVGYIEKTVVIVVAVKKEGKH